MKANGFLFNPIPRTLGFSNNGCFKSKLLYYDLFLSKIGTSNNAQNDLKTDLTSLIFDVFG